MWGRRRKRPAESGSGEPAERARRRAESAARRERAPRVARHPDHLPPPSIPGTGITPITRPPDGGPEPAVYGLPPWADEVKDR